MDPPSRASGVGPTAPKRTITVTSFWLKNTEQSPVPEQASSQPRNVEPGSGDAVRSSPLPCSSTTSQSRLQLTLPVLLVTLPWPVPWKRMCRTNRVTS